MLSKDMENRVGRQRGACQEWTDTSSIKEFFRMNPPSFTRLSITKKPMNFTEELKKVFEVMYVADTERVDLAAYLLKCIDRTLAD